MHVRSFAAAIVLFCASLPAAAADLVAHAAKYDLAMVKARGDVAAASGTMSYEVVDACEGWTVHQRLVMTVTNSDGQDVEVLSEYTTFERRNGNSLSFRSRQMSGGAVTSEVAGEATMSDAGGTVKYATPDGVTKKLAPGTLFPMAHTAAILKAAAAGQKFIEVPLFDGTSPDGAQNTSVAILPPGTPPATGWPSLAQTPSVRVHIAFFDQDDANPQPDYEVTMRYWPNGIADDLQMDFGDFVMRGRMTSLTMGGGGC